MDEQTIRRIRSAATEAEKVRLCHNWLQENSSADSEFFRCDAARRAELTRQQLDLIQ